MSNHITSINSLINQSNNEDEDRKFLRAAAEAIVATSMNNQIDPTILELLKRIQYASSTPQQSNNNSHQNTPLNNFHHEHSHSHSHTNNNNTHTINGNKLPNFPTFNINYFDNLNNDHSSTTSATSSSWNFPITNHDSPLTSQHNNNNNTSHHTPNSIISTPPSSSSNNLNNRTPKSTISLNGNDSSSEHNPEKPFVCNDCALSFRRSSDLRRHQRAHLPILPHICQLCGKGFARKDALKRHSDTLTCKRNREKLLSSGGDLDSILTQAGIKK